jgi:predicted nucleotidyltransferase
MAKTERKIIKLLSNYPEREFYAQEITKIVKCSKASASGILKLLMEGKIVSVKVCGHMKFYQINPRSPRVKKLKIDWALEKISPLLPKLEKFSKKIVLFGSASRGEDIYDSDIDLFVLTRNIEQVKEIVKKSALKNKIQLIIKMPVEFSELKKKDPYFYREIDRGIVLWESYEK